MRSIKVGVVTAVLLFSTTNPSHAQNTVTDQTTSSYSMDGHTFTLTLPAGYKLADESSPFAGFKTFGFVGETRDDGMRGVIQVGLFDVREREDATLDLFADRMVAGMRRGHGDWKGTESSLEWIGVPARKVEWSGYIARPSGEKVAMRGVVIMGIKDGFGFRLETQDTESRAEQSLSLGENAFKTFVLTVAK